MATPLTSRQQELFDALHKDFLHAGFADFTIDSAAARHHCSKSTLYALGATRNDIIRRVLIAYFQDITARTSPDPAAPSATAALQDYFESIAAALEPASQAFLHDLAHDPVAQEVYAVNTRAALGVISNLLRRGVDNGEFAVDSIDFCSLLIQNAMTDIQQGAYSSALSPHAAYRALGAVILQGITRPDGA